MEAEIFPESKLGFGCMRLPLLDPDDAKSIDVEQVKKMVDVFMASGNTYFDTAYVYHEGASEAVLKEALVDRYPRDSFTIATKCPAWSQPTAEAARACLDISLERLGVDYVDYYLLHNLSAARIAKFDEFGLWDYFAQKKAEGKIRYLGFSLHDGARVLEDLLRAHPDVDFVQLQVNYLDWEDPVTESHRLMEVAAAYGKPVVIMEPARGGRLCDLPVEAREVLREANPALSQVEWAYRFCWDLPGVVAMLSGASTLEQMEENTAAYARREPLDEGERAALDRAVAIMRSMQVVSCTNCRYCVESCPLGVKIPTIMGLLNLEAMTGDRAFVEGLYSWQAADGRASTCVGCGVCENLCPQKIDIIRQLAKAVDHFE